MEKVENSILSEENISHASNKFKISLIPDNNIKKNNSFNNYSPTKIVSYGINNLIPSNNEIEKRLNATENQKKLNSENSEKDLNKIKNPEKIVSNINNKKSSNSSMGNINNTNNVCILKPHEQNKIIVNKKVLENFPIKYKDILHFVGNYCRKIKGDINNNKIKIPKNPNSDVKKVGSVDNLIKIDNEIINKDLAEKKNNLLNKNNLSNLKNQNEEKLKKLINSKASTELNINANSNNNNKLTIYKPEELSKSNINNNYNNIVNNFNIINNINIKKIEKTNNSSESDKNLNSKGKLFLILNLIAPAKIKTKPYLIDLENIMKETFKKIKEMILSKFLLLNFKIP